MVEYKAPSYGDDTQVEEAERKYRVLTKNAIIGGNHYTKNVEDDDADPCYGAVMLTPTQAYMLTGRGVRLEECDDDDDTEVTEFEAPKGGDDGPQSSQGQ